MININELNMQVEYHKLEFNNVDLGQVVVQYFVRRYIDVRNLRTDESYLVECTIRTILNNENQYDVKPDSQANFHNYPALYKFKTSIEQVEEDIFDVRIASYSPKTLNSSIETSQTKTSSSGLETSRQHTKAHGQSSSNMIGGSIDGGWMMGPMLTASFGGQHSWGSDSSRSDSSGRSSQMGRQATGAISMSIKDWATFASLDVQSASVTWVWGQEYPWNTLQFNSIDENNKLTLPDFVISQLTDGKLIYPPSDLALFGLDVTSTATWLLKKRRSDRFNDHIVFSHAIEYTVGSHGFRDDVEPDEADPKEHFFAKLNYYGKLAFTSTKLDLAALSLVPLTDSGAAISFRNAARFNIPDTTKTFRVTSDANDMLVEFSGFDNVMSCKVDTYPKQVIVNFKVMEQSQSVVLQLKNWLSEPGSCTLRARVNGYDLPSRRVSCTLNNAGDDNVETFILKHEDFASQHYCNFLQFGMNTVEFEIESSDPAQPIYHVDAIAVSC